ncbi:MAG: response regulator [Phormidesmis sp.]
MRQQVLIIEDEQSIREIFMSCLDMEGFDAIGADNGVSGVQLAQQHLPSLVVCDIMMPHLNGYGVLSRLRENAATALIPVVFLTAKCSQDEIRRGMQLGADDYLTKPSTMRDLLNAVTTQIEKRKLLQRCFETKAQRLGGQAEDTANKAASIFPKCEPLQPVFDFIEANYHKPITLSEVAQAVGYSPAYLTSQVGTQTQYTVNRWIIERRMTAARQLLCSSDLKVEEIATIVGYQNTCHFSRQFRKHHEQAPNAWRRAQRQR